MNALNVLKVPTLATAPKVTPFHVLLFYKYVFIHDADALAREHLAFCQKLGVRGRVLIAEEGINGTVSGTPEQCAAYMAELRLDSRFEDVWFKCDAADGHVFSAMHVRTKKELVTLREDAPDPNVQTGRYLSPAEWREIMQREDVVILDGRSDYEWDAGHFEGAVRPHVQSFREFPAWIREHFSEYKDKTVLTYCTGGIRCEKLTGFLLQEGFRDVAQLHGGIVHYAHDETVRGEGFVGRCYVFDGRVSIPVDKRDAAASADPRAVPHRGISTTIDTNCDEGE
jgi:UPF0176 protein